MAENEHVNKVELSDGTVLVDLTEDTVEPGNLLRGETAHSASGEQVTGIVDVAGTISTSDIDNVVSDQSPTGTASLRLTGLSYLWTKIKAFVGRNYVPIAAGIIYPYAGSTAPTGYLMCDGTAYSRTEYSVLFSIIGTTYGAGDGSTTFNVPDLRGRTPVGSNTSHALGTTGGEETHVLTPAETATKNHSHTMNHGHGFTQPTVNGGATTTGGGGGHGHEVTRANNTNWYAWRCGLEATTYGLRSDPNGFQHRVIVDSETKRNERLYGVSVGNHTHSQVAHTHSVSGGKVSDMSGSTGGQTEANGSAHNNMQPYQVVNYIISTGS